MGIKNASGLKKIFLALVVVNLVGLAAYHLRTTKVDHINLRPGDEEYHHVEDINYDARIQELLTNAKEPNLKNHLTVDSSMFLNDTASPSAWRNKDTIFQDPRLAISLTLNHLRHQLAGNSTLELPFHWADWVDLTYLNHELEKPVHERMDCKHVKEYLECNSKVDRARIYDNDQYIKCMSNEDVSPRLLAKYGFLGHSQVPGYIYYDYSDYKTDEKYRLMQGKTFLFTNSPNPYKIMFLNDHGEDLVYNVTSKQKIIFSGLMNQYVENNRLSRGKVLLNPVKEFNALVQAEGLTIGDKTQYQNFSAVKELTPSMFHYGRGDVELQISLYKRMAGRTELDVLQRSFLNSLERSKEHDSANEITYFKMSSMRVNENNTDNGWHYDWRFFNGKLVDNQRTNIILERLMRNWFKFATKNDMTSWIMHGPLLSWYWSGQMFPYDNDIDIQMPVEELVKLGELYNQTLVVEDLNEGYGKFLIDVGTYIHNRDVSKRSNHIDARFIDVDSGIYIDITGLSTSKEATPKNYYKNINDSEDEGTIMNEDEEKEVYNDRRLHYYNFEHLSPLKMSMFSGVPTYIPNEIIRRLKFEYPRGGLVSYEHKDWYFVPKLQNWVHQDQLLSVVDPNDYLEGTDVSKNKLITLAKTISDEQLHGILAQSEPLQLEFSHSKGLYDFHKAELSYLVKYDQDKPKGPNDPLDKQGKMLDNYESGKNEEYDALVKKTVRLDKPLRMSLFEYEHLRDVPAKHN
ncbi:uncharacterized protein CANTADRAFT_27725 [Suhomyces tanzawaensis NRRL Y-17324]|uniref:LicD/FKTN/FKRP nucleotidyltransferase domain-containing protein n=1 Tax=Suhomyces tanzawaensis NRRL Y-17324 TaxID=984487 RepID=A0A1E4SB52_9ASCO|nr:uncharacterized protein CANTADRAFT_27725 [Suhomyces tanzawaensis NRRL Y-17324]ODV76705.1 hypothetical protein CANTADRAFT_27725 [Suhomyces tanzawaensis NRRL Y-17324]